jgi:hypothetical protein
MGGKRSPIRSHAPRWRPGRYKGRHRAREYAKPEPFRPVRDTLIAIGANLVAAVIVFCLAVPLAATYHIPVFLSFGAIMLFITVMTYRVGGKGRAGPIIAAVMIAVCVLGSATLFLVRDQLRFGPHDHDTPAVAGASKS